MQRWQSALFIKGTLRLLLVLISDTASKLVIVGLTGQVRTSLIKNLPKHLPVSLSPGDVLSNVEQQS